MPEAAREYQEALRLRPEFDRAHLDLATVLAAQGDMPGAIQHLRTAAQGRDPRVAQAAAAALQRLEPHSPIPYLINRAVELGALSFPELMRILIRNSDVLAGLNRELGIKQNPEE